MTDGTGTRTISYNANLQPSGEMFPSAFFGGRILTRTYDSRNRPTGFALGTSSDPAADHAVTYGYDAAGRLATVQDPSRRRRNFYSVKVEDYFWGRSAGFMLR